LNRAFSELTEDAFVVVRTCAKDTENVRVTGAIVLTGTRLTAPYLVIT